MNELLKLKRGLLGQEPSEQEQVYVLCAVMEICGGYEQLLKLPLPALKHIIKFMEYRKKQSEKSSPKMRRK